MSNLKVVSRPAFAIHAINAALKYQNACKFCSVNSDASYLSRVPLGNCRQENGLPQRQYVIVADLVR